MEIFSRHMALEMSFPSNEGKADFGSNGFCEHFQGAFKSKEAEMDEITGMIRGLNVKLDEINTASASHALPRDPTGEEAGTPSAAPRTFHDPSPRDSLPRV